MLDITTLRVTFTAVAVTVFALLVITLWSGSRSAYAVWWCLSLLLFLSGDVLYIADGTSWQWLSNPIADTLVTAGAAATWCGASSLRYRTPPLWQVVAGPLVVAVFVGINDPGSDSWAGGPVFLATTALYFGLCCRETWRASRDAARAGGDRTYELLVVSLSTAFGLLSLFYAGRTITIAAWGSTSEAFVHWFGTGPTTLMQLLLLVIVAFSMASLVNEQKVRDLHERASHDSLTGLLNRAEFLRLAGDRLRETREDGRECVLVMADIDYFKRVNDTFGHAAGDQVLRSFGAACSAVLRSDDLVARVGGEEFTMLLPGLCPSDAERLVGVVTRRFQSQVSLPDFVPTVSYGIAPLESGVTLQRLTERADSALYRAKRTGRDRVVHYRG